MSMMLLIRNVNHVLQIILIAMLQEDVNVLLNVIPQEQLTQLTINANVKLSMELLCPIMLHQMNVFVHQTFLFGMENIALLVQLQLNMIQKKNNAIIVHKGLSETM